jgi:release factor glutamine methyltransferase
LNVRRLHAEGARTLREGGVSSPDWDAELLLCHVLGWNRARFVAYPDEPVGREAAERYRALVAQRARRRPLQHLTGVQWFWKHPLVVSPDVLIPRPETEVLVEAGLDLLAHTNHPTIVDVGTGSGCLALAFAFERGDADVHATDVSEAALEVARENARRLGLAERVSFHRGDLLEPLAGSEGRVDLVASNPPYVGADELSALEPEVREHEPPLALVPPGDRFSVYRRLAERLPRILRPGGHCVLEVGAGMADEVARLLGEAGLRVERIVPDLAGVPRAVVASRAG